MSGWKRGEEMRGVDGWVSVRVSESSRQWGTSLHEARGGEVRKPLGCVGVDCLVRFDREFIIVGPFLANGSQSCELSRASSVMES